MAVRVTQPGVNKVSGRGHDLLTSVGNVVDLVLVVRLAK
jgi:hypothetical protein